LERITIVGMSPIGASIGLALKQARLSNTEIVGSSGDRAALSKAAKMGAMDKEISSLGAAVRDAQLIIIDMPFAEMRDLLDAIAPIVEDGCVITDTGTTKVRVLEWADSLLPKDVSFVGGHPLLRKSMQSLDEASASLFEGVEYSIMPSKRADEQAVKTVAGLIETLKARPLFLDLHEHDSYAVAMEVLPMVLSSAFVTTTTGSESWREMHKMATGRFAEVSRLASLDPLDNEASCLANPEALIHWIDQYITELYAFRNQIKEKSDDLVQSFIKAWEGRAKWDAGALSREKESTLPSAGESMAAAFLGERLINRYKQMTGDDKNKEAWKYNKRS
jgi:prephenate dehydrogenase